MIDKEARAQVLQELTLYLRKLNGPNDSWRAFFDRPLVVTAVGTVAGGFLISILTLMWQRGEQERTREWQAFEQKRGQDLQFERSRIDQKFQLLRTFSTLVETNGNIINHRLLLVLWQAEEQNKPADKQVKDRIDYWRKERHFFEKEQYKTEPLEGVLAQIGVIFGSDSVKQRAKTISDKWLDFERLLHGVNNKFYDSESLTVKDIDDSKRSKKRMVDDINTLSKDLIREMGAEISKNK